jgi:hypothetical protein
MNRNLACIALLICARAGAADVQTVIDCDLKDAKGAHYAYSFLYDPGAGKLSWVQGGEELKVERHTATDLVVSREGKFGDSPARIAYFDLLLAGGGETTSSATMSYFRDPTAAEIATCDKERPAKDYCRASVPMPQYDEAGTCTYQERPAK